VETCTCEGSVLWILCSLLTGYVQVKCPWNNSYKLSFICNHITYKTTCTLVCHRTSLRTTVLPRQD
jgi:hypothetical protein